MGRILALQTVYQLKQYKSPTSDAPRVITGGTVLFPSEMFGPKIPVPRPPVTLSGFQSTSMLLVSYLVQLQENYQEVVLG